MIDCLGGRESSEWMERLAVVTRKERVPLSVSLELTRRCNLRCAHCYVTPGHGDDVPPEMTTQQVVGVIDQLTDAGCLLLLITGGEPLLRDDFPDIYAHARKRGLVVTVFTNATLVSERITAVLREFPPRDVDVTVYGATEETYERVTGRRGSFAACMKGIDALAGAGLRLSLKTVLMTPNKHELEAIQDLARRLGAPFRADAALFPRFNGDREPLTMRLEPEAAAELEVQVDRIEEQRERLVGPAGAGPLHDQWFICGAGRNSCHIDASGCLYPCLMARGDGHSLLACDFMELWLGPLAESSARPFPENSPCRACTDKLWCGYCPEYFKLETGDAAVPSEWMCRLGRLRREKAEQRAGRVGQAARV